MRPPTLHAQTEPVETIRRAAARSSSDPAEAGRQHSSRRRIDCDGGPDMRNRPIRGRGTGSRRQEPPTPR